MFTVSLDLNAHGLPASDPLTVHGVGAWVHGTTGIRYSFHDPAIHFPGSDCPVTGVLVADKYIDPVYRDDPASYDFDDEPAVSVSLGDPTAADVHDQMIEVGDWGFSGYVVCSDLYLNPGPHPDHADRYPFEAGTRVDGPTYHLTASLLRAAAADYVHRWKTTNV
ncbi:hypothetical protein HUT19_41895 (plasmid) [Streptomyces sp. NA02950]|uniref:hypothetical protein n=1 Tax=Streptomyces sp. NA02950 TaxID=2742137 RepID=UPI0015901A9A|nr:hypothetical protein [Streptomyces sp. NA02950]QKV98273.1 hypothetical protein HUT19_41895 [Streptomyces sp. NA02950]